MSQSYGHLGHVQINEQGSLGQIFTDSLEAVPFISEGFAETIEQLVEGNIRSRHAPGPTHEGPRASGGPLVAQPYPETLGHFLRAATGVDTVSVVDSAYQHIFTPLVNSDFSDLSAFPPMTVVVYRSVTSADAYGDQVLNQLDLEIAHSQLLQMTANFIGGQHAKVAKATPVIPVGAPWAWNQGSLSWGGVGVPEMRGGTVTLNNNLEVVYTVANSTTPQRIKRTDYPEFSGSMTLLITAAVHSYMDSLFQAGTEVQVLMNFNGVTSPGNLLIDIPKARITAYAPTIGGPGQIETDIEWIGKFDETSSYLGEYTLTNCRVSYP